MIVTWTTLVVFASMIEVEVVVLVTVSWGKMVWKNQRWPESSVLFPVKLFAKGVTLFSTSRLLSQKGLLIR